MICGTWPSPLPPAAALVIDSNEAVICICDMIPHALISPHAVRNPSEYLTITEIFRRCGVVGRRRVAGYDEWSRNPRTGETLLLTLLEPSAASLRAAKHRHRSLPRTIGCGAARFINSCGEVVNLLGRHQALIIAGHNSDMSWFSSTSKATATSEQ